MTLECHGGETSSRTLNAPAANLDSRDCVKNALWNSGEMLQPLRFPLYFISSIIIEIILFAVPSVAAEIDLFNDNCLFCCTVTA